MFRLKIASVLMLLLALPIEVHSQSKLPNSPSKQSASLVGEYFWGRWYMDSNLKLFSNGKFKQSAYTDVLDPVTGVGGSNIYGDYNLKDGILVLSPSYSTPSQGAKPKCANVRTKWRGPSSIRLLPVKWANRQYLIYANQDELNFCNAINLGEEPRPVQKWVDSSFFLRVGDDKKLVTGRPQLPQQWLSYLLPNPIEANVITARNGSNAKINAGKEDGLKLGMILTNGKSGPEENLYRVVALQKHQATIKNEIGQLADIKVFDGVSTRRTYQNPN